MATLRNASKGTWNSSDTLDAINAGSLQRIADATETIAINYDSLIRERDMYKRWYEEEHSRKEKAQRRITALRGVITRMKRREKAFGDAA